ncbi:hypothetical protein [Dyella lutea]|uniref:Uncharacterized protein n=1 Tax=Dyella lutea TaxID=2950441 RepID=A0ABT1FGS1_9GAMM|nr:hypothetical protein [Dyella lutea]MCP1375318.1 hypothetical protein [Dyella lutea]
MKLQFEGQQWRVRIDEDELQTLLAGDAVTAESHAAGRFSLVAVVRLSSGSEAVLEGDASHWSLALPEAPVRELAGRLPTRDGLLFELLAVTPAQSLQVRFDVDVRDSARRLKVARQGD